LLQFHAGSFRGVWIESVASIDQRAGFCVSGSGSQSGEQQTCPPGAGRAKNFRQRSTRQTSGQRINFRDPGGNSFNYMAIAIRKWSGDTPSQGKFDFGAQSSEICSHSGSGGRNWRSTVFAFSSPTEILYESSVVVNPQSSAEFTL
jgi:hypothetical protein